jgi:hypothetical protein
MPTSTSKALSIQKRQHLSWLIAKLSDSDLITTVLFCLVGLTVTAVVMLRFPNLGAIIAQYNQF